MFSVIALGIGVGDEEFAMEAVREEGPGGMFLASSHTLAHFREWVFMSPIFRSQAYVNWQKQGSPTADQAATAEWKRLLESYTDPGIDPGLEQAMAEFIARRKSEIDAE
jgi:trimethylamine--corrinoid protein Co-methyltransferase